MLAGTPDGDAYTYDELEAQFTAAGFRNLAAHQVPTPQTALFAEN